MLWTDFHFCWTRQLHIFVLWCILTGGIKCLLNTHLRGFAVWHMPLILPILQCILVFPWTNLEISRILWTTRCDSGTIKSNTRIWKLQEKLNMHVSWHDWNTWIQLWRPYYTRLDSCLRWWWCWKQICHGNLFSFQKALRTIFSNVEKHSGSFSNI